MRRLPERDYPRREHPDPIPILPPVVQSYLNNHPHAVPQLLVIQREQEQARREAYEQEQREAEALMQDVLPSITVIGAEAAGTEPTLTEETAVEQRHETPEHDIDNRSETVTVSGEQPITTAGGQRSNVFESFQEEERQSVTSTEQMNEPTTSQLASERTPLPSGSNLMNFPGLLLNRALPPESPGQLSNVSMSSISTACLLYTSPSPRDLSTSRMPSSA